MVGRILYLKNNHIPPTEVKMQCKYLAFGYYDGINFSENMFGDGVIQLEKFWLRSVSDTIQLTGGYSSQSMYLFRDLSDDEFWQDEKKLPFIFVAMLQLDNKKPGLKNISRRLENEINAHNNSTNNASIKACSYLTLDGNDIILVMRSNDYKVGMEVVESFHIENNALQIGREAVKISYSFTVSGIFSDFREALPYIIGKPDYCHIHIVEKQPGEAKNIINDVKNIIQKKPDTYMVLGRDDQLIGFPPDSWEQILRLYTVGGPFVNDEKYRRRALNVSSRFLYEGLEDVISFGGNEELLSESGQEIRTICGSLKDALQFKFRKLVNECVHPVEGSGEEYRNNRKQLEYYKTIWQILNSIEKFEHAAFPDYIYISIYAPLQLLVEKITALEDEKGMEDDKRLNQRTIEGIFEFLSAINQISQNMIKADRQFMQTPELNAGCYHAPVKMSAYYAAFADHIKNFLNVGYGQGNKYEFMLYPGMNEQLRVKRVFSYHGDRKRLMLVEIPEKQMFEPKYIMITLAHEIAHFVGSKLRRRENRYDTLISAIARMISIYAYTYSEKWKKLFTSKEWEKLDNDLVNKIRKSLEEEIKEYIKNNPEREEQVYHAEYLKAIMINGISSFLEKCISQQDNTFEKLFGSYFRRRVSEGKISADILKELQQNKVEFHAEITQFIYSLQKFVIREFSKEDKEITVFSMVDMLFSILKESFADLASILMLNLSYEDYFRSILHNNSYLSLDTLLNTDAMIRVAIVSETMNCRISGMDNEKILHWSFGSENTSVDTAGKDNTNEGVEEMKRKVIAYHNLMNATCTLENVFGNRIQMPMLEAFGDGELLRILVGYLLKCRRSFEEKRECGADEYLDNVRKEFLYVTENGSVEDKIMYVDETIQTYREHTMDCCKQN